MDLSLLDNFSLWSPRPPPVSTHQRLPQESRRGPAWAGRDLFSVMKRVVPSGQLKRSRSPLVVTQIAACNPWNPAESDQHFALHIRTWGAVWPLAKPGQGGVRPPRRHSLGR